MDRKPPSMTSCPSGRELEAYAWHQLAGARRDDIELHVPSCTSCLHVLAALNHVPSPEEIIRGGRRSAWRAFVAWWQRLLRW